MIRSSTSIGISCTTFPTTRRRSCYPLTRASRLPRRWRDDRFFPAEFQRRAAKDRLGSMPARSQAVTWSR